MLHHPYLTVALSLPLALAFLGFGALLPFFLLGLAGKIWWRWQLRQMRYGENPFRPNALRNFPAERVEEELWLRERQSLAEIVAGAGESPRKVS